MSRRRTALTAAALAFGAATASFAAQRQTRRAVRRLKAQPDTLADEQFGSLRGRPMTVTAADGVRLYAEIDGDDRDDIAVVFSHGWTMTQDSWHFQRAALRGTGRLVFWDHRGHGRSEGQGPYTLERAGADLATVVRQTVPVGTPVVLVGHSMGGMAIMKYADLHPEEFGSRIVGAGLLCTSSGNLHEATMGLPRPAASVYQTVRPYALRLGRASTGLLERGRGLAFDPVLLLTNRIAFGPHATPSTVDFTVRMVDETRMDALIDFYRAVISPGAFATLEALSKSETLVIGGKLDLLTPYRHSRIIADAVPGARLETIPDAGHMAMFERHEAVSGHLRELIKRVS